MVRLHNDVDMFYVHRLWGMRVSEHPIYQSLLFLLLFIVVADVAMVPNLEKVPCVAGGILLKQMLQIE